MQATPRFPAPPAPSGLTATAGDANIELSWTNPSDATISRYQVRLSTDGGTTWNPEWADITGSAASTVMHMLTGLTNETEYTIELRAVRGLNTTGAASRVSATPSPAPAAPKGMFATAKNGGVKVTWDDPDDPTITKYQYRIVSKDASRSLNRNEWEDVPNSGASTVSHTETGLINGRHYSIFVRAMRGRDLVGRPDYTEVEPGPPPSAPAGLGFNNRTHEEIYEGEEVDGYKEVTLFWDPSDDPGVNGYQYRLRKGDGSFSVWTVPSTNRDRDSSFSEDVIDFQLGPVDAGTTYTLELRAVRSQDIYGPAASTEFTPYLATHYSVNMSAPERTTRTTGDGTITLKWNIGLGNDCEYFNHRVSSDNGATWDPDWTRVDDILDWGNTYTYTGLTNGTVYTFELRCVSDRRNAISEVVRLTATPNPVPPLAPVGLSATAADARVRLDWTDPGDDTIDRYQYRQRAGGGSWTGWTDIPDSGSVTTSHTVKDLTNGTAYTLELRAVRGRSITALPAGWRPPPASPGHTRRPDRDGGD